MALMLNVPWLTSLFVMMSNGKARCIAGIRYTEWAFGSAVWKNAPVTFDLAQRDRLA